jgi:four helix bundle protein
MKINSPKELKVYKEAHALAMEIFELSKEWPPEEKYSLTDQIRRASVSIPSNIAEGDERGSNKDAVRFFYIAKGSLAELQTQLEIANEIDYLDDKTTNELMDKSRTVGKMLGSLIKARSSE